MDLRSHPENMTTFSLPSFSLVISTVTIDPVGLISKVPKMNLIGDLMAVVFPTVCFNHKTGQFYRGTDVVFPPQQVARR